MCLNFRLNYLGEIKWRDWATTILFDRVWTLGDPVSLTYFMKCSSWWGSQCSTRHDSCYIYTNFSTCKLWVLFHCPKQLIIISDLLPQWEWHFPRYCGLKLFRWLYHIHICPIAPQNHPGENISLLQFNPLKINWTWSIICCSLNQESCITHW